MPYIIDSYAFQIIVLELQLSKMALKLTLLIVCAIALSCHGQSYQQVSNFCVTKISKANDWILNLKQ